MRKFLIPLLLASALAPAAASAQDGGNRAHAERDHRDYSGKRSSDDRPQRAEREQRSDRADRPQRVERPARIERSYDDRRSDRRVERRIERPAVQVEPVREARPVESVQRVNRTGRNESLADGFRSAVREHRTYGDRDRDGVRERRDYDRDDDRRGWRDRDGRSWRWSSDWRRDNRYDWRSYRNRYGSIFRLGRYYDPYGYGYRRFSIGFNLWPSYYGSSFWLDDPWQYRLPPAYGPYRWIRYYDDALLVNIYTGQVVDVIHNVFW